MTESRPSPEGLLKKMNTSETKMQKGRLKIFFGYAAGVGKTYAMLDAAHSAKETGIDVVIGYIEPHTRPETMALLQGLELLPPQQVSYKGITLNEFDLDGALARRPELVIVDELAHTNAEGCRHIKRYDDIQELLNAGMNVYTTVNVQHLESLNDIVASITEVIVKERVPDWVFDGADQVELVDIEPDDLIYRLNTGKIYKEKQASLALRHFFARENLVALREIALRRTADRVNRDVEINRGGMADKSGYVTGEHILVCLSASPSCAKVIRAASRMTGVYHASFTALYVSAPEANPISENSELLANIKLAKQLGAKIVTVNGSNAAYMIAEYAKASGISKIILGRSNNKQRLIRRKKNLVEQLTQLAPNFDIYIIPDNLPPYVPKKTYHLAWGSLRWQDVLKTAVIIAGSTAVGVLFSRWGFSEANIIMVYILGVLLVANQTSGYLYGIAASLISVFTFNFFFTVPKFTFQAYDAAYPFTFLTMFAASIITSTLTMRVRMQARENAITVHRTEVLLDTSQQLQRAEGRENIIGKASTQLIRMLHLPVVVYPVLDGRIEAPRIFPVHEGESVNSSYLNLDEQAVANWVFKNKKRAGRSTETLPGAKGLYLPIRSDDEVLAVLGICMEGESRIEPFAQSLLAAMLNEIAFALEKDQLAERQKQTMMQAEQERLRANLLRAISHDLRTPLTSISGSASVLMSSDGKIEPERKHKLLEDIYDDSLWLINLVENILSVTRIEDGRLELHTQPELIEEVIDEALHHINRKSKEYNIQVHLEEEFLMAYVDVRLIVQVLINMIDNAIKYTEPGSSITISARRIGEKVIVEVADNGCGIEEKDKAKIFDMFFTSGRKNGDSRRGLGLGLSLCKSIVNAHGGEIYVRDRTGGGTVFGFTLKYKEVTENE